MNYSKIYFNDTINGEGLRTSLFVSGCTIHCKGCFNSQAWDFNSGIPFTEYNIKTIINNIFESPMFHSGLSVLGGEPLDNIDGLIPLMEEFEKTNKLAKNKRDVWLWTGYTYEQILADPIKKDFVIKYCDTIVAGPFIEEKKDLTLRFRGSTNQEIIKIEKE